MTDEAKRKAIQTAGAFYQRLRRLLRRYRPQDYGPLVAKVIYSIIDDQNQWRYYPIHFLVNSIEANCAYHQWYHKIEDLTQARINEIMNHYQGYHDPYLEHVLDVERNLELMGLAFAKQQFPYQRYLDLPALARAIVLFSQDYPLPKTEVLFREAYELTIRDWIYLCFSIFSNTTPKKTPVTSIGNYVNTNISGFPKGSVASFFEMASLSPAQIAERYKDIRTRYPNYLHIFLPSIFLDHPLVRYDDGQYLAVHPGLIYHYSLDGLYQACQHLPDENTFYGEFGSSFERYIGTVLNKLTGEYSVLEEQEIQAVSPGKSCDYVVVTSDSIVLIECKAVRYSATLLTEGAIKGDNSTHCFLPPLQDNLLKLQLCSKLLPVISSGCGSSIISSKVGPMSANLPSWRIFAFL